MADQFEEPVRFRARLKKRYVKNLQVQTDYNLIKTARAFSKIKNFTNLAAFKDCHKLFSSASYAFWSAPITVITIARPK